MTVPASASGPRETEKEYVKEDWKSFILREPDTFLGSGTIQLDMERVYDSNLEIITGKRILASQALKHTFTEALSNAQDAILRSKSADLPVNSIKVKFLNQRRIEITNIGADIMSVKKNDDGEWVPESLLGNLLSGSNSKAKNKVWAGKNGVGGTLVNIMSSEFSVEVWDHVRRLYYKQEWENNCTKKFEEPTIIEEGKHLFEDYQAIPEDCGAVKVSFLLDFSKFITKEVEDQFPDEPMVKGYYNHSLMEFYTRKVLDCSLATQVPVHLLWTDEEGRVTLDKVFQIRDIQEYSELFFYKEKPANFLTYRSAFPASWKPAKSEGVMADVQAIIYDTPDDGFTFSFVNGQPTELGGVHVDETCKAICSYVIELIEEELKEKSVNLVQADIMNHLSVFIYAVVPDPKFTGQTKGKLTSPRPAIRWYEGDILKVKEWSMVKAVVETLESKRRRLLSKTDGKKVRRVNIAKAEDANMAGGIESQKCVLWLCEGDSAKNYALTLLDHLPGGRNYNGIYPLSGKILNTMKAKPEQIAKNKQVIELKVILGLQEAVDYTLPENYRQLRYGKVGVLTDMDMDGSHIKYLLIVLFGTRYPGILETQNMITWMSPIIRAKRGKQTLRFFTMEDFHSWKGSKTTTDMKKWTIKYYKGLGGSNDNEVEEDVRNPHVEVTVYDVNAKETLELAFSTKKIDSRKVWINERIRLVDPNGIRHLEEEEGIRQAEVTEDRVSGLTFEPSFETLGMFLNNVDESTIQAGIQAEKDRERDKKGGRGSNKKTNSSKEVTVEATVSESLTSGIREFTGLMIEKKSITRGINQDYMAFNLLTLKRSIPSEIDGLKVSERKIIWTGLKSLKNGEEIKTVQFGNIVAKETDYAHNEQILEKVISAMTSDFPTANNLPYFKGNGQFGFQYLPRAASGRYTHVEKAFWLRAVYREEDDAILPMVFDEGRETEPEFLIPIIPMTLINGACGIANGFSTFIPQYNPIDVLNCLEAKLKGDDDPNLEASHMTPWYRNHKGSIELIVEDTPEQKVLGMQSYGCYEEHKGGKVIVTELPVGLYGEKYCQKLKDWRENFGKVRKQSLPGESKNGNETRSIKDFNNLSKKNTMRFELFGIENASYQSLGIVKRFGMTNMTLLDSVHDINSLPSDSKVIKGQSLEPYIPRKFSSLDEYMDHFIRIRLYYYGVRKNYLIKTKTAELETMKARHRFIKDVVDKVVDVFHWKEDQIIEKMSELGHQESLYTQTSIRRFSPEEVARLSEQIALEMETLNALQATHPRVMWMNDLKEFRDLYLKHFKGEDGVRKTASRKLKLVKVKRGTKIEDDIEDLIKMKDSEDQVEEGEDVITTDERIDRSSSNPLLDYALKL